MSQHTSHDLIKLLDQLASQAESGTQSLQAKPVEEEVLKHLPNVCEQDVFSIIGNGVFDKYSHVSVDLIIVVLRRWVEITNGDSLAKRILGLYLYLHGPDWDEEAEQLLQETESAFPTNNEQ